MEENMNANVEGTEGGETPAVAPETEGETKETPAATPETEGEAKETTDEASA